jgi:hypothetical protein
LTSLLECEYQLSNIDKSTIEFIIQNKTTLFFFDGLDEIFDIAQKNNIRDDIVNFITNNKNVKCIITSRFIGYHDISFPTDKFYEFSIQDFNDKQIEKFIEKFYNTQIQNKSERKKEIENCKKQLKEVDQKLKSNPLILSLMSLLALNKLVIPDSKLEVYRSCTNTLVETRDKNEKELTFNLKVKNKRGTFGNLAYWQYCQVTDKKKVSRILAGKVISDYLIERKEYEDVFEADEAAEHFLKYAEYRSIYFDNTFTHKTFLEYYAADYICKRFHNGFKHEKRDEIISNHINNSSWHIIFELLIAMIDEQIVETDILDNLIETHMRPEDVKISYFFLSLLLNINNICVQLKKKIISNAINIIIEDKDTSHIITNGFLRVSSTFALLIKLSKNINIKAMLQEVILEIESSLLNEQDTINFYIFFFEFKYLLNQQSITETNELLISQTDEVKRLIRRDPLLLMSSSLNNRKNSIGSKDGVIEILKNFGVEKIFTDFRSKFIKNLGWSSIFNSYVFSLTFELEEVLQRDLENFEENGLTLDIISSYIRPNIYINNEEIKKAIKLYLNNNIPKVDMFLEIILSKLTLQLLKNVGVEFEENPKYSKLLKSITETRNN